MANTTGNKSVLNMLRGQPITCMMLLGFLLCAPSALMAQTIAIPGLFNTGVNDSSALLPGGSHDPHYALITSADPSFPGPAAMVVNTTGYPIPPWMSDGPNSEWIAPSANEYIISAPGLYVYRTTFNLAGFDPNTAVITGHWVTDNEGVDILINGISTGLTTVDQSSQFTTFQITSGFVSGLNTLDFKVNNGPTGGAQNPTGLRVELSGTAALMAATFFPQVAVGGGADTLFTITNTGSTAASGNLILTNQQGNPFTVSGVLTDSSGTTHPASVGSSFSIYVPTGGTVFLSANALSPNNPTSAAWAELESTGGSLTGVATYEYVSGGIMQYIVGVLQSPLLQFATIPMDNDNTQAQQMAYAIANPSSQTISIKLALVGQDGTVVDDTVTVTLSPGQQIARYLWQDLSARTNFKGSLVLRGQAGASFTALLLQQKQSLFTVIPLISGKAPGIPD